MRGPSPAGRQRRGGDGCMPRPPSDAVRHCSGSTTYSKDRQAFAKRGILGRLTPSRSYNVDEDPNLCGYHMDGQEKWSQIFDTKGYRFMPECRGADESRP